MKSLIIAVIALLSFACHRKESVENSSSNSALIEELLQNSEILKAKNVIIKENSNKDEALILNAENKIIGAVSITNDKVDNNQIIILTLNDNKIEMFEIWSRYLNSEKIKKSEWNRIDYSPNVYQLFSELAREIISKSNLDLSRFITYQIENKKLIVQTKKHELFYYLSSELNFPIQEIYALFIKYKEVYDPYLNETIYILDELYDPKIKVKAIEKIIDKNEPDESWFDCHDFYTIKATSNNPDKNEAQLNLSYSDEKLHHFDLNNKNFISINLNDGQIFNDYLDLNIKNSHDSTINRIKTLTLNYKDIFYFEIELENTSNAQLIQLQLPSIITYKENNINPTVYNLKIKDLYQNNQTKEIGLDKFVISGNCN